MKHLLIAAGVLTVASAAWAQDRDGHQNWQYGSEGAGEALVTYVATSGEADDGASVELRFSHSDLSGRQLRLNHLPGPIDCAAGCRVELAIDGAAPDIVRATMPPETESTLSLRDARTVWRSLAEADLLEIAYPLDGGTTSKVRFNISGVDQAALPGWD